MQEDFEKMNDYTLRVTSVLYSAKKDHYNTIEKRDVELTRIFNFESAQVTTIGTSATVTMPKRGYSGGSGVSDSMQVTITDFADLPSTTELARMHAKLKKLGGNPPALEETLGNNLGKKTGLGAIRNG